MSRDLAEKLIGQSKGRECHIYPRVRANVPVFPPARCIELEKRKMQSHFYFLENTALCRYLVGRSAGMTKLYRWFTWESFFSLYLQIHTTHLIIFSKMTHFRETVLFNTHFFTKIEFRIFENIQLITMNHFSLFYFLLEQFEWLQHSWNFYYPAKSYKFCKLMTYLFGEK